MRQLMYRAVAVTAVASATALPCGVAAADTHKEYVKYYVTVATYHEAPENIAEIATRFLGSDARGQSVVDLNANRIHPQGGEALTAASPLADGTAVVLPWDAAGSGVQYGLLPAQGQSRAPSPGAPAAAAARPSAPAAPVPTTPASPPAPAQPGPPPAVTANCTPPPAVAGASDWAQRRLAADAVWSVSRGRDVLVAVVDSGVDSTTAALAGHVMVGGNITSGTERGDIDCLGSGTAMAGLIAASQTDGQPAGGVAPDATVLPLRIVTTGSSAKPSDIATAIEVAVSAGARVIALGGYVDPDDPAVADAIASALRHDVVVVVSAPADTGPATPASAPTGTGPSASGPAATDGLVRVAGVDEQGRPTAAYRPGGADIAAPGSDVAVVAGSGARSVTGTQYAVALVAGTVALIRSAQPGLTAPQVAGKIRDTAAPAGPGQDAGAPRLINPRAAVTDGLPPVGRPKPANPVWTLAVVGVVVLILVVAVLLLIRLRRQAAARDDDPLAEPAGEPLTPAGQ
ncbi:S8 family serine peptidase [Dactylosporangium sp. CA-092794]|uniref:S8 family serine peptidase n=1 Tax=Dactylosporangium sp. CA-092794 TaxID=3239929 RepID=UPI003D945585